MAEGVGYGKLLLFGEHAAVYGFPALGITLPLQTAVCVTEKKLPGIEVAITDRQKQATVEKIARRLAQAEGMLESFFIEIESTVPEELGFGSSAALCVAMVRALLGMKGETHVSSERVWLLAHEAEKIIHGTPSGIDTGLALKKGIYAFAGNTRSLPAKTQLKGAPFTLLVGSVARTRSTKELIEGIKDQNVFSSMEKLGAYASNAISLLQTVPPSSVASLAQLANDAQDTLRSIGLSTGELDLLLKTGLQNGALGGKLSGAGGGGAFFLLFDREKWAQSCRTILQKIIQSQAMTASIQGVFSWQSGKLVNLDRD